MKTSLLTAFALFGSLSGLEASTVTVTCTDNPSGGVTLSYTVTADPGETIKDFHVCTNDGHKIKGTGNNHDNGTPGDTRDDWTWKKGGGCISWWTRQGGIAAGRSLTFTMTVPTVTCATLDRSAATWITTSNGEQTYTQPDVIDRTNALTDPPIYVAIEIRALSLTSLEPFTRIGYPTRLQLLGENHFFDVFAIAASTGDAPGIQLTPSLHLPLNPDPLFVFSFMPNPAMQGFQGVIQPPGRAQAQLMLPPDPLLIGFDLYLAAMTLQPAQGRFTDVTSEALATRIGN